MGGDKKLMGGNEDGVYLHMLRLEWAGLLKT